MIREIAMFSETSRYQKKEEAKNYLSFKYVVENTRLKKNHTKFILANQLFFEIEPRKGTSICTESLWRV